MLKYIKQFIFANKYYFILIIKYKRKKNVLNKNVTIIKNLFLKKNIKNKIFLFL